MQTLKSAIADTGKSILPEHLALAADCLSATGEFVPINAKGLSIQRKQMSASSPFTQACFSVSIWRNSFNVFHELFNFLVF